MTYLNQRVARREPGLGFAFALAPQIFSMIGGPIGSFLGGSDPKKDAQRKQITDTLYNGAMGGDAEAEAELACRAGERSSWSDQHGMNCAIEGGSKIGQAYAQQRYAELQGRVAAGNIGVSMIGASNLPTQVARKAKTVLSSPVVWIGVAGVVAFLLLRRRGR